MESLRAPVWAHCCSSFTHPQLFKVIRDQLPEAHCYADDTQLYLSFKPYNGASQTATMNAMEGCIEKIREWMIKDKLMINDSKTEFILIGTRQQLCKLQPCAYFSRARYNHCKDRKSKTLVAGWTHILTCPNMLPACVNQLFSIFII